MKYFILFLFILMNHSVRAQRELKFYENDFTYKYCINLYKYKSLYDSKELFFYENFFLKSFEHSGLKTISEYEYLDNNSKAKVTRESVYHYQSGYLIFKSIIDYQQKKKEETYYIYSKDKLMINAHIVEDKNRLVSYSDALFQFDESYNMTEYRAKPSIEDDLNTEDLIGVKIQYDKFGNINSVNTGLAIKELEITVVDNDNIEAIFSPMFSEKRFPENLEFTTYSVTYLLEGKAVDAITLSVSENNLYWLKAPPNTRVYYAMLHAGFDDNGKIKTIQTINNDRGDERVLKGGHSRKYNAHKMQNIWNEVSDIFGNTYRNKFIVYNSYVQRILPTKSLIMQIK